VAILDPQEQVGSQALRELLVLVAIVVHQDILVQVGTVEKLELLDSQATQDPQELLALADILALLEYLDLVDPLAYLDLADILGLQDSQDTVGLLDTQGLLEQVASLDTQAQLV
jgi:hypothetical protein